MCEKETVNSSVSRSLFSLSHSLRQYLRVKFERCRAACRLLDGIEHVEIARVTAWRYQGMSRRQDREAQEHEGTNQHS